MKRRLLAALTACTLLLTGCASLLEREYIDVTPHNTPPTAEGDPSTLRAESYQELVNGLIYFISQSTQTGAIRLYSNLETAESDLQAACQEVVQEDPLGAYAVADITYRVDPVVSYCEAQVQISYRRTPEQIASIIQSTGTAAIRSEAKSALAEGADQLVLRISHFDGDEDSVLALCREAYYADPGLALDMPDVQVALYPDQGRQRIVELDLSYHLTPDEVARRRDLLLLNSQRLVQSLHSEGDQLILDAAHAVLRSGGHLPTGGSTAYHALVERGANDEGLALAMALLCQELGVDCHLVVGTLNDRPHFWNQVACRDGWMHLDLTRMAGGASLRSDDQARAEGYGWEPQSILSCG